MHGVGAGGEGMAPNAALSEDWMAAQHTLQKQILQRMRALGIVLVFGQDISLEDAVSSLV
jgi:hypothetical protein